MDPETLWAIAPYSIAIVLLLAGLVLLVLPLYRAPVAGNSKWIMGLGALLSVGGLGVALVLLVKPPPPGVAFRPVPTYEPVIDLPTPVGILVPPPASPISQTQAALTPVAPLATPDQPIVVTSTALASTAPLSPQVTSLVQVWAIDEEGVRVNVNAPGVYNLAYLGDAYSLWPEAQVTGYKGWTTLVKIYFNRPVEWGRSQSGLIGPIDAPEFMGDTGFYIDRDAAINVTQGASRSFRLNAGDYLTLVVFDQKGKFGDNRGKVDIGITYGGP